jgi:type IV pilus assembly protein PilC
VVIFIKARAEGLLSLFKRRFFSRVGINDVVNFTRQLATMIGAGLVITDALTILKSQAENPNMAVVIDSLQKEIEGGTSLSAALAKNAAVFDPVYIALIRSGETAGILDQVLTRLATNLEAKREFLGKVRGAMVYPAIIISGMFLVGGIMIIFVVPKLLDLYQEFEATLPTPTIILIAVSRFLNKFWWLALVFLASFVWGLRIFAKTEVGRMKIDSIFFSLPVIGRLRKAMMLNEFTRTVGLLVGGGVLVMDALNVALGAVSSSTYKKAIVKAAKEVEKGTGLAVALAQTETFPPLLPQMVSVGEETGRLDEVLLKIASYFEQEAEVAVRGLTTAIEPLIMILLGLGVGFLIIAVIMPIYNLTSQF